MKFSLRHFLFFFFVSHVLFSSLAAAQPDSGLILQEQRPPAQTLPDRLPDPDKQEVIKPALDDTGVKVTVKGFRFTGRFEGMATEAELQELVKDSIGKELTFAGLQHAAAQVTNYLREKKGFLLARAYLPKQDVTAGIIEIAILSGRVDGQVKIDIKPPSRIRPGILQGLADHAVPEGSPARMDHIERAVLLMNDLPGISAQASLEPGRDPGTTRLVINAAEQRLFHALLSIDNHGDRYTGDWRGMAQASLYDPLGLGDQLTASFTGAEHMYQARAAYGLPLGSTGLAVGVSYTHLFYRLGKELEYLDAKGQADTIGANLTYPLLRTRRASLWAGLGGEHLILSDEANTAKTRDRKLTLGNASLTGNFFDGFAGGGLTSASITGTAGSVDLSGLESNKLSDDAGPKTHGGFTKMTYSLARLQRVTRLVALFGSIRGQLASGNLDSSQKFILGGPTGVRAYPVSEAPGVEGHAMTAEARVDIPFLPVWAQTQLVGFFDAGWIKLNRDLWPGAITNAAGKNDYPLAGAGAGLNVGKAGLYSLRASYAHKIGPNEGRSTTGKDADNQSDNGRFWLQAIVWF